MTCKIIPILIILLSPFIFSSGQKSNKKITVTGTVLDAKQKPVVGASIFIDKAKTDVLTDQQGHYKVKVRPDAQEILVFTLFYGAAEELINGRTAINFTLSDKDKSDPLQPDNQGDNNTQKKELSNQPRIVDGQNPAFASYQSIYDMIRGRVAGVEVSGKSIKIMGSSSLNVSTEPLFVVDGVIVNTIEDISPQTVKSIEVLKGPAATVWGMRGSNGVIVITRLTGKDR